MGLEKGGVSHGLDIELKFLSFPAPWGVAYLTTEGCKTALVAVLTAPRSPDWKTTRESADHFALIRRTTNVKMYQAAEGEKSLM